MAPGPLRCTPAASSHIGRTALPRNVFARLTECRQTPGPDSGIEALGAGLEVWHLRSHTLDARERPENTVSGAAFPVSKDASIPSQG